MNPSPPKSKIGCAAVVVASVALLASCAASEDGREREDAIALVVREDRTYEQARQSSASLEVLWGGTLVEKAGCFGIDLGNGEIELAAFLGDAAVVTDEHGDVTGVRLGSYETILLGEFYSGDTAVLESAEAIEAFTNGTECAEKLGVSTGTLILSGTPRAE